jgi:hypothetical protein
MKNGSVWIASAIAGLLFIFILNAYTSLGHLKLWIPLPFGWHHAPTEVIRQCDHELDLGNNDNNCTSVATLAPPCGALASRDGLPFVTSRSDQANNCLIDHNTVALLFDALAGIILGPLVVIVNEKHWPDGQSKK